ncbi:uncharacterized protein LOC123503251 isoform X2 [Portunus trituberculatus]|uniref:uncharacterized protein LOC123503251 isoform X2 n=1 Tax=Portunus trituberculatus TaxID=210409 RepID=UPI001E1CFC54|nr:uncharacterized protein LOC123503251 isoform X2 [Portunus trituberculatus]XP_045108757.1 uncharacterized protein LOC123503251 isoform X2 [Portunus trituberculatus]
MDGSVWRLFSRDEGPVPQAGKQVNLYGCIRSTSVWRTTGEPTACCSSTATPWFLRVRSIRLVRVLHYPCYVLAGVLKGVTLTTAVCKASHISNRVR